MRPRVKSLVGGDLDACHFVDGHIEFRSNILNGQGLMLHVLGLEFDGEHNGEVRFQISLFLKKLQAFTGSMLTVT
jgi:predicted secreted protein